MVASSSAQREFVHLHKSGPLLVSDVLNLRPISVASDLAAVQDALFLSRNQHKLSTFWGPSQSGGLYDALACVLCVVLLVQNRIALDLPLLLGF